ncbi:serine/threonine-protein kinase PAK 3-like isoform X2 [Actinia tenebrosa]|uniref:non-specific serine/threonine protein kinase n=1 Tax=Actinia tenebrosa TaxID=6105 RepID=A0A6P8HMC2_ACTTE|nr:serine/threonine-protein kinase PAK 3-like isoform X2 [Actinia tenebrosa]
MADEERPPAPPLRLTSNKDAISPGSRPLPSAPIEEKKKKTATFRLFPNKGEYNKKKPEISYPTQFEHTIHVGFDPVTGEFTGMPEAWARLLQVSNITQAEQKKNPQAVLDVLNFYDSSKDKAETTKFMTTVKPYGQTTHARPQIDKETYVPPPPPPHATATNATAPQQNHAGQDEEALPPAIPTRPEITKSKYIPNEPIKTKHEDEKVSEHTGKAPHPQAREKKKKKMSDEEIICRLRTIVSIGDPKRKYTKFEKIGQGASGTVYTAIEVATGHEVAIKQMNLSQQPKKVLF